MKNLLILAIWCLGIILVLTKITGASEEKIVFLMKGTLQFDSPDRDPTNDWGTISNTCRSVCQEKYSWDIDGKKIKDYQDNGWILNKNAKWRVIKHKDTEYCYCIGAELKK